MKKFFYPDTPKLMVLGALIGVAFGLLARVLMSFFPAYTLHFRILAIALAITLLNVVKYKYHIACGCKHDAHRSHSELLSPFTMALTFITTYLSVALVGYLFNAFK